MSKTRNTKTLKNRADALFSQIIRARGVCERCGRRPPEITLQCAHILSRKYTATRWLETNALSLCVGCHHWGHMNPVEWGIFLEDDAGVDVRALREEARSYTGRVKKVDYEALVAELKEKLEKVAA